MSPLGYLSPYWPKFDDDRFPSRTGCACTKVRFLLSYVRFLGLEVRSTSDSRRRWARSAKTGFDPRQTSRQTPSLQCSQCHAKRRRTGQQVRHLSAIETYQVCRKWLSGYPWPPPWRL